MVAQLHRDTIPWDRSQSRDAPSISFCLGKWAGEGGCSSMRQEAGMVVVSCSSPDSCVHLELSPCSCC